MSLVEITCLSPKCPDYKRHDDGSVTGRKFMGYEIPASRQDPGYVEGYCPCCGEENQEWEVENMSPEDIEYLRLQFTSDRL